MVHRIARLVHEGVFAAETILATSFNRDANREIRAALKQWSACVNVQVKTLHALGFGIIQRAYQSGLLPHLQMNAARTDVDGAGRRILYATLSEARRRKVKFTDELNGLDHEDFLNFVGAAKGNLAYPDLEVTQLPPAAQKLAQRVKPPPRQTWYRELYAIYEQVRQQQGLLTFDDMLMTGWEILVRYPAILDEMRYRYHAVMVDEFQDVNLAQAEILDLLTHPHRNYMAIGDDDQTIYEWRGASPQHMLKFRRRYRAKTYFMTDNFRNPATQLVLANRVIAQNKVRQEKRLQLTQGFEGDTHLHMEDNAISMGKSVAQEITNAKADGFSLREIAILVRLYAQTPPLEQALIAAQVPYWIVGGAPFYRRPEVQTLLNYVIIAQWEDQLQRGQPLAPAQQQTLNRIWPDVYNRPLRYISRALGQQVAQSVIQQQLPFSKALLYASSDASNSVAKRMNDLAEDLIWLSKSVGSRGNKGPSAEQVVRKLTSRLGYVDYLQKHGGFTETGASKAVNVVAFLDYTKGKGSINDFLSHVEQLFDEQESISRGRRDAVLITSIFKAKGLEWPMVFVPDCNDGVLPLDPDNPTEEERRLMYVAITRAQEHLHLHVRSDEPMSQFLLGANINLVMEAISSMQQALATNPDSWEIDEYIALALNAPRMHLIEFFQKWWQAPASQKQQIAQAVLRFYSNARAQGVLGEMGLQKSALSIWKTLAGPVANQAPLEIPGQAELFAQFQPAERKQRRKRRWFG